VLNWVGMGAEVGAFVLVSPASGPPRDCGELVQAHAHDDRDVFQASPDELPAIDIHSL
jgi:hypothetical protein